MSFGLIWAMLYGHTPPEEEKEEGMIGVANHSHHFVLIALYAVSPGRPATKVRLREDALFRIAWKLLFAQLWRFRTLRTISATARLRSADLGLKVLQAVKCIGHQTTLTSRNSW